MNLLEDDAICIRCRDYSESSQLLTFFGREHGKVHGLGKGTRRQKGAFRGGVDLLSCGHLQFQPARGDSGLATIIAFDLTEAFAGLRRDLLALNCAQLGADLVAHFTEEMDPAEELFAALESFLSLLADGRDPLVLLVRFELALLRHTGMGPVWHRCALCRGELPARRRVYFSSSKGGMLCRDCEGSVPEKRLVAARAAEVLAQPQLATQADRRVLRDVHEALWYHQRELLGRETAVMAFVNRLIKQKARAHSGGASSVAD